MQCIQDNNIILIRLFPGENIISMIKDACKKFGVKNGIILSGIGQLRDIKIGFFKNKNNYLEEFFNKTYELLSLSGNICRDKDDFFLHIHVVLGDEDKNAIGGHLFNGTVEVTNEIAILKTNLKIDRKYEEITGLQGLIFK